MATPTAPTRGLGSVEVYMPTPWLVDPAEFVPELMWPTSVFTYAKMRRDPTIRSVLNAYMLPILSAAWSVDPRGASPAMTRIVADSVGLPVLGEEDRAADGPVNTRWVRWGDHLRAALGDLVFGFMPFEPIYDTSTGAAYLSALPERMPWSITEIDVDDATGALTGIRQARAGQSDITLPAERLLYYVHAREGANWAGTSLLREAFGPWLFKQDAMRGAARTLRRYGTPVPVMEPVPGFNPTPAQLAEAQRLAQSYRGDGDRAGAVSPGFALRLVGVQGTIPDHIPWLRYLDEQIARSTLTSVLDLGSTSYGSRALGTVFLDLLVQAMQAVAEDHAVTASRLARQLTDYNEGTDAQAPLIVVGDVASSRQTLAQTVAALVTAGALSADTSLEGWIRDAFDLPAASGQLIAPQPAPAGAPTPTPGGADVKAPAPVTAPVAPIAAARTGARGPHALSVDRADRRRHRAELDAVLDQAPPAAAGLAALAGTPTRTGRGTQAMWPYRRDLTTVEAAAGLDPVALDTSLDGLVAAFLDRWPALAATQHDALLAAVTQAVDAGDLTALAGFLPPTTDVTAALADAMVDAYDAGVTSARGEARAQGHRLPDPGGPPAAFGGMAAVAATSMATSLVAGVMREAMRLGGDGRTPTGDVVAGVSDYLTGLSTSLPRDVAGGLVGDGINTGRVAVMADAAVPAHYYASEVRDGNTCGPCLEIDGTDLGSLDEAEAAYPAGGYVDCDGGLRCRGIIVARYDEGDAGEQG